MHSRLRTFWLFGLVGLLGLFQARPSHAAPQKATGNQQRFVQLLASRRSGVHVANAPLNSREFSRNIAAFNRMIAKQGPTPPRIPRSLLIRPRPTRTAALVAARQRKILALYRTRAHLRGGVAGGVFFTPPAGTPYYPVSPSNIFTYFPVYRA